MRRKAHHQWFHPWYYQYYTVKSRQLKDRQPPIDTRIVDDGNLNDARPNSDDQVQPVVTMLEKGPPRRQLHGDTNNDLDVESKGDYTFCYIDDFSVHRAHVSRCSSLYHEGSEGQKHPEPAGVCPPNLETILTDVASGHCGPTLLRFFHDTAESRSQMRANLHDP